MTLYVFCSDQKIRKRKKPRNYDQNFNVKFKLLVSLLSQTCENVVQRREKQRCTGQLDNSSVSCGILLVSDCIQLYHKMILNYFKPLKFYLIVSNSKLGTAPPVV